MQVAIFSKLLCYSAESETRLNIMSMVVNVKEPYIKFLRVLVFVLLEIKQIKLSNLHSFIMNFCELKKNVKKKQNLL